MGEQERSRKVEPGAESPRGRLGGRAVVAASGGSMAHPLVLLVVLLRRRGMPALLELRRPSGGVGKGREF